MATGSEPKSIAGRTVMVGEGDARYEIGSQHVTFTEKLPGEVFSAPMPDAMVYVDVRLDDDLEKEGYEREVIRRSRKCANNLTLLSVSLYRWKCW